MYGRPTQTRWSVFVCVLRKLGYTAQKGKAWLSTNRFVNPSRSPEVVSFREPIPETTSVGQLRNDDYTHDRSMSVMAILRHLRPRDFRPVQMSGLPAH
jgi:hypothetical protein